MTHSTSQPTVSPLSRLSLLVLCVTLWLTQWCITGLHSWVYAKTAFALSILSCFLVLVYFLRTARQLRLGQVRPLHLPILSVHATLYTLLALLQIIPLPASAVAVLNPGSLAQFVPPLTRPTQLSISLNPHDSVLEMLKWLPLALTYFLTIYAVRTQKQALRVIWIMTALGLFQAGYGLYQTYSGSELIWYFSKIQYRGYITGTYVSRNQLAFYLEAIALVCFGTSLGMYLRVPVARRKFDNDRIWQALVLAFGGVILAVTLLLSASRGGIISFGIALCAMAGLMTARQAMRRAGFGILLAAIVIMVYGISAGLEKTAARFEHVSDLEHRLDIAASVLPMIRDYPFTGVGIGVFNTAYEPYALPVYGWRLKVSHAHNDWVEIAAETGLPGFMLCTSGYLLFLGRCLHLWTKRRHPLILGTGAGILCALLAIGVHSFFDFGMRVPANVLTIGMLCGLLWVLLHMRGDRSLCCELPAISLSRNGHVVSLIVAAVLVLGLAQFARIALRHDVAERLCPVQRTIYPDLPPSLDRIIEARAIDPDAPEYMTEQATCITKLIHSGKAKPGLALQAISLYEQALQRDPANGLIWRDYAALLAYCTGFSFGQSFTEHTALVFARARTLRPHDADITLAEARYLLQQYSLGRRGLQEGLNSLAETIRLAPHQWKNAVDLAMKQTQDDGILLHLVEAVQTPGAKDYVRKKLGVTDNTQKKE